MITRTDPNILTELSLFDGLSTSQLAWLREQMRSKTLAAGAHLMTAEQPGKIVYFVLRGTVKIHVEQADGHDVILAILGRGDDTFAALRDEVRKLFPTVENLRLEAISQDQKRLTVKLKGQSEPVPAEHLSEGLLYFIAYLALKEVTKAGILLIEEPENGLHPSRIRDVVAVLRAISESGTQVVIATHSPLVINELKADEVSVVTRDPATGTKVTPIAETPNFRSRADVYELGELWLSYADGDQEAPLFEALSPKP